MKPVIRAAHSSEAAAIAGMSRLQVEYGLRWRWTPGRVKRHIQDANTMVLVASDEGSMIGFAIMRFGDTTAHLLLLAVEPTARRQNVGRSMIEWLEKSCRTAGIQRIQLELRSQNGAARLFYGALGFHYVGQIAGYYDCREAATILGKSLAVKQQSVGPTPG